MGADYNLYLVIIAILLCLMSLFLFFIVLSLRRKLGKSRFSFSDSVLLETLPVPVFLKNTDGRYSYVNQAFEDFFETRRERIVGKRPEEILSRQDAEFIAMQDSTAGSRGDKRL